MHSIRNLNLKDGETVNMIARTFVIASIAGLLVACGGGGTNLNSSFTPTRYWVYNLLWNESAGRDQLHKSRSNGTGDQLISHSALLDSMMPAFSDDGSRIAYYKQIDATTAGVFVMDAVSGSTNQISEFWSNGAPLYSISWSRDGTKLLYSNTLGKMFSVNSDGSNLVQITPETLGVNDSDGSFSPDGTKIVFERGYNLWSCNADGSNQVMIANSSSGEYRNPNWSPDGSKIVCVYNYDELTVMNPDGSGISRQAVSTAVTSFYAPRMSPDGSMISFAASTADPGRPRFGIVEVATNKVFWRSGTGFTNIGWINQP